ncbi:MULTISPECIES: aminotransferase class I/II-fold pyridoxal phosphate-dependent enzyme [Lachnospiraceae]|jgi:LL-diaminopimelate aminotransferase|uniref:Aminotransferase class I/II-fold pyridoxal phosphate-dependent enzyme n=1 Tax=Faecalicatena acetigenes TaxID=2981790 RepID=A0ABT2TFN2_9FIRM|nr:MULTISPECIES: aminotransferase class I/II-fold pyridoxal phosphate-dependent enzyme [Lachnospiraceae]MCU6748601.1 aminotransferase class I/II-fold pyridoxal phosphate-dependent enzyme [Faecalicatena acetigenes]RGT71684.1 aminotransferase class I/II-fold pyridoxal phosphate-dependent enzyme [Ruminococcus sp. AF18-22]SCI53254.1 LL-diaminopimelate aminotransferase [uncultured Clostridium sp.]
MKKIEFSNKMNQFETGIFAVLNEKKEALEKQGRKVFNLSVGTPDFAPAPHVMEAMRKACEDPQNYKYALSDLPELLNAVQYRYKKRFGVELEKEEITSVYGTQEGMAHIGMVLCNPGDMILVPDPGYPLFEMSGIMAGARVQTYPIEEKNGYLPQLSEIPEDVLEQAKYMIVSYPLNPVCVCAPDTFYPELIAFAKRHDIVILHDNAYSDIIFSREKGRSFLSFEGAKEVGAEFYSLSKSYNLTGARISFLVGNKEIVQKLKIFRSQIDYGIFLPVQYAAIAALTGPDTYIEEQRQKYKERNQILCGGLRSIGWDVPDSQGTMFVWAKIPENYETSVSFCMDLMEKTGVIVTPGSAFGKGGERYVRMALVVDIPVIQEMIGVLDASGIFLDKK